MPGDTLGQGANVNWQSYEELAKDIYQRLGQASGVTIECWGPACRVHGSSGTPYQIDVLASHTDGLHRYRTAIDCKYWDRRVGRPSVAMLSSMLHDTGIEKGVLVSLNGFTEPAERFAAGKRISLVRLRPVTDADWNGFIRRLSVDLCLLQDVVVDSQAVIKGARPSQKLGRATSGNELRVPMKDGSTASLRDVINYTLALPISVGLPIPAGRVPGQVTCSREDGLHSYSLVFEEGTPVLHGDANERARIESLDFKVKQVVIRDAVHVDAADRVAWILEAIFEEQCFAISPERVPTRWTRTP